MAAAQMMQHPGVSVGVSLRDYIANTGVVNDSWSQMGERFGNRASNLKVASSIPGRAK